MEEDEQIDGWKEAGVDVRVQRWKRRRIEALVEGSRGRHRRVEGSQRRRLGGSKGRGADGFKDGRVEGSEDRVIGGTKGGRIETSTGRNVEGSGAGKLEGSGGSMVKKVRGIEGLKNIVADGDHGSKDRKSEVQMTKGSKVRRLGGIEESKV